MTDDATHASVLSVADLNTTIPEEPRVLDVRIGARLGMTRHTNIRQIIEANRSELERYGVICTSSVQNPGRGRPSTEYWLNEAQTILLCMLSRTEAAAAVRQEVIGAFLAYRMLADTSLGLSQIEAEIVARLRGMTLAQRGQLLALTNSAGPGGGGAASGAHQTDTRPEPPFCAGCAARFDWFDRPALQERAAARSSAEATDDDIRSLPFLSGPLTHLELGIIVAYRFAVRAGQTDRNLDTLRAVAQALGVSAPPQDTRRLPPAKGGTR